jgi:multiple sugar transport system permease protein
MMILQIRKNLIWYAMIAPTIILFSVFTIYPTLQTFWMSFFQEAATEQRPVGLMHYSRLLTNDVFIAALFNTLLLGVAHLALVIPISLLIAVMLNQLRIASNLFKAIYFLPQVTSTIAIVLIFSFVFQPNWGLINGTLRALGVETLPLWLADPRYVLTGSRSAVTLLSVWITVGYYMLIFLAGLQTIPADLYDAAAVDGANSLQSWWYITLPSLRPTFVFLIITGSIDAMSRFSDLWMLGGPSGTPARSLQSIVMFIYQTAFEGNDMNLAAAASVILFLLVLGITIINFRTLLRREFLQRAGG